MAQTSGLIPANTDNVKKKAMTPLIQVPAMPKKPRRQEAVPGLMATRNTLRGIRTSTIPNGHPTRGK